MTPDPAIRTVDHDKEWPRIFDAEKTWLKAPLGDVAERMKHVGSPPVPGLAAKPIIDIDVYVKAIEPMRPCREPLEKLGYLFVFDPEFLNLHFFEYPEKRPRCSHVHVAEVGSRYETRHLAVRDLLRAHPDVAADYVECKRTLTAAPLGDRDAYNRRKSGVHARTRSQSFGSERCPNSPYILLV
jgi:GrpB-like predicted nucleotidyltransferase (UPF0157 family)